MSREKIVHGGDWAGFEEGYGFMPVDFSANVSPLGMPEAVRKAAEEALGQAERYPDPLCRELVREIAASEDTDSGFIMCGNGAADLVFRLCTSLRPERTIITAPTFAEYEAAVKASGGSVVKYRLHEENDFRLGEDFPDAVTCDTDLVILCQPNNPTGITDPRGFLMRVLEKCRETDTMLMIDECFNDFLDEPHMHTMKELVGEYDNLLILRSFTKMYGMAGLRLGYCICSDTSLLERMRLAGQPWAVSHIAQRAGLAALHEKEYVSDVRRLIAVERRWLIWRLQLLHVRVIEGEANFILFKSLPGLDVKMKEKGLLIRNCGNYEGLEEGWYRIAVRTRQENEGLMKALEEAIG